MVGIGEHLSRSLRFSAHCRLEGKILKAVARGMEFGVAEVAARRWWTQNEERSDVRREEYKEEDEMGEGRPVELVQIDRGLEKEKRGKGIEK